MKNIDIASVQKRRFETYEKEKDNLIVVRVDGGYTVSNLNKASSYKVSKDANSVISCTCKDYSNFKGAIRCKHIIAVLRKAERINTTAIKTEAVINKIKEEEFNMNSNENKSVNNNPIISAQDDITILQAILSRPFPQEIIRYREGQKKRMLAYVETVHYIDRLNEAFSYQWNWEILSEHITDTEVYCRGRLTVVIGGRTVMKEAYGGKDLTVVDIYDKQTRQVNGKKPFSIADDLKSASSDALKKACSLLGIGLHLYKSAQGNSNNTTPTVSTAYRNTIPSSRQTPTTAAPTSNGKTINTPSQVKPSAPVPPTTTHIPAPAVASSSSKPGNGKGGNGAGGDINRIIERW